MGQIKFIASIFMIVLFTIAIVSYVSNFGDDNSAVVNLRNESRLSDSALQSDLDTFRLTVNSTSKAFSESTIEAGDENIKTGGVFKTVNTMYDSVKRILGMGSSVIFGNEQGAGPGIVITALGTFLVILAILYAWKTWAGKTPD